MHTRAEDEGGDGERQHRYLIKSLSVINTFKISLISLKQMIPNRRVMYYDSAFSIFFKFMRSWLVKALVSVKGAPCMCTTQRTSYGHCVVVCLEVEGR